MSGLIHVSTRTYGYDTNCTTIFVYCINDTNLTNPIAP